MGMHNESPHPTPGKTVEKPLVEQTEEDSAEVSEKKARKIMLDFLVGKNFLTNEESALVSPEKVDELIVRTAHEYEHVPNEISQQHIDTARRILGLQPNLGDGIIDTSKRGGEIKRLTEEMKGYLENLKSQCSEVLGMLLCGSRMDPDKLPAPNSDVDIVLVLKEGTVTDPRTSEGEASLFKLRAFMDSTPTESGFPVELDELYSTDVLLAKLKDPTDKSKLTWGWNPNIVKYVGDSVDGLDESGVQIKVLEGINHPDMLNFKKQKIAEAKKLVIRYLGDVKTKTCN